MSNRFRVVGVDLASRRRVSLKYKLQSTCKAFAPLTATCRPAAILHIYNVMIVPHLSVGGDAEKTSVVGSDCRLHQIPV